MAKFGHKLLPGNIAVKDKEVLRGLMERRFAPILITIITELAKEFGIMITESYREKQHPNDLHGTQPVRALDLRSWAYSSEAEAYEIMQWVNQRWAYDFTRLHMQAAIIHKTNKGALHFHIQVHPNTRRR